MKRQLILLILITIIILTTIPFSYAVNDFAYNRLYSGTQPIDGLNYSINTNSSSWWVTGDRGALRNVEDIRHSWLNSLSLLWSNAAHIINIAFDFNGQDAINISNLEVNDNATINDFLQVNGISYFGPNANQSVAARNPGDMAVERTIYVNESISIVARQYQVGFFVNSIDAHDPTKTRQLPTAGSVINTTTGLFCDTTNTPFFDNDTGKYIALLASNIFGLNVIPFEILSVINSTCVDLSLATFGADDVPDIAVFFYVIGPPAIFAVLERGSILSTIGGGDQSSYKISVPNANGPSSFEIDSIVGSSGTNIFEIATDVNGSLDSSNFESSMFSAEQVNGTVQHNLEITADLTNFNNGSYIGQDMGIIHEGNNMDTTAISVSSLFDNIITSSQLVDISLAYYDDTTSITDITTDIDNPSTLTTLFEENDSALYIGNTINFTKISISVSSGASQSILPDFFYCNLSGEWESLSVADSTEGFLHSGVLNFRNPLNRGTCNKALDGTPFVNTTNFTYIAIRRTEFSVTDDPIISSIKIERESSKYLIGNADGVTNANTSMTFSNEEPQVEGSITHVFDSLNLAGQRIINGWSHTEKNNTYSGRGNSLGIIPQYWGVENFTDANGNIDMHNLSNYITICSMFGPVFNVTCQFLADTRGRGMPLLFTGDLEVWLEAVIHGGTTIRTMLDVILSDGERVNIIGGPLYVREAREEQIGFDANQSITRLIANFEQGALNPFVLITSGKGADEWAAVSDPTNCPTDGDFCAHAGPVGGSGNTTMQTNFTTSFTNNMNLTFKLSTTNLNLFGLLIVSINDNLGNTSVLYSLAGGNVVNENINVSIPATYENKTLITVEFDFSSVSNVLGDVWVDTINITGNTTASTLQNVTRLDSDYQLGDGSQSMRWNDSSKILELPNVSTQGRYYLPNGGYTTSNETCDIIEVGRTGNIISTRGCE